MVAGDALKEGRPSQDGIESGTKVRSQAQGEDKEALSDLIISPGAQHHQSQVLTLLPTQEVTLPEGWGIKELGPKGASGRSLLGGLEGLDHLKAITAD